MEFSRQRACILSRSALQLLYLSPSPATTAATAQTVPSGVPRPHHIFIEILRDSIKNFVNPPVLINKPMMPGTPQVSQTIHNSIKENKIFVDNLLHRFKDAIYKKKIFAAFLLNLLMCFHALIGIRESTNC